MVIINPRVRVWYIFFRVVSDASHLRRSFLRPNRDKSSSTGRIASQLDQQNWKRMCFETLRERLFKAQMRVWNHCLTSWWWWRRWWLRSWWWRRRWKQTWTCQQWNWSCYIHCLNWPEISCMSVSQNLQCLSHIFYIHTYLTSAYIPLCQSSLQLLSVLHENLGMVSDEGSGRLKLIFLVRACGSNKEIYTHTAGCKFTKRVYVCVSI